MMLTRSEGREVCRNALLLLVTLANLATPVLSTILDKQVRAVDIQAVEGKIAEFPCEITSALHDKVHMVFWFRDDAGIPLYSFDVRGVGMSEGKHWSAPGVFGPRAFFRATPPPSALLLQDVKRHDEGIYRCRVDYRNSQTVSFRYNLSVIVPPAKPVVVDRSGGELNGSRLGPKEEGDDLMLTCTVRGGRPSPTVRWLVNGILVDVEYEHSTGDVIENRLSWPAVGRQDYGSIFTCQAVNSELVKSKEASFTLDMNLKPLTVEINKISSALTAEKRYTVTCRSTGSRPSAVITWYKGKRQLKRAKEEIKENITISELNFVPTSEDNGRSITCRAENPNLSKPLETSWKIEVVYPPQVTLRLGSTLSAEDIKEGDDVYFECHVHSNPPWRKLSWMHNGALVSHNSSAGVVHSNQSLVLQRVARHSAGRYSCSATNPEGETVSNELTLRVKFAPVCRRSATGAGTQAVGAARNERVLVVCEVDADPPARAFKWKFNNSGETLDVGAERYTSNGSVSTLRYTPMADLDYGTLSCTAMNEIGHQAVPCMFQLVAAGKPQPVGNCTLSNLTSGMAEVACEAGFDGGLPQTFMLEVYSDSEKEPRYNMTGSEAVFMVTLEPDVTFRLEVFAANAKGRSQAVRIAGVRMRDAEKRTASGTDLPLSPLLGAGLGALLSLLALTALVTLRVRRARSTRARQAPPSEEKLWLPPTAAPGTETRALHVQQDRDPAPTELPGDDRDPDVIPANYEPPPTYTRTWGTMSKAELSRAALGGGGVSVSVSRSYSGDLPPRPPPATSIAAYYTPDSALNVQAFKEKILDTRLPESCV